MTAHPLLGVSVFAMRLLFLGSSMLGVVTLMTPWSLWDVVSGFLFIFLAAASLRGVAVLTSVRRMTDAVWESFVAGDARPGAEGSNEAAG